MTEQNAFEIIDNGIDIFKQNDGWQKRIKVSKRPQSDWLVFNWRQLTWKSENKVEYLIEIFPNFNRSEKIESWTFYTAVYYDEGDNRHYLKKEFASHKTLTFIAENVNELLVQAFNYITSIEKLDIPLSE
jgi:hypothetical protein